MPTKRHALDRARIGSRRHSWKGGLVCEGRALPTQSQTHTKRTHTHSLTRTYTHTNACPCKLGHSSIFGMYLCTTCWECVKEGKEDRCSQNLCNFVPSLNLVRAPQHSSQRADRPSQQFCGQSTGRGSRTTSSWRVRWTENTSNRATELSTTVRHAWRTKYLYSVHVTLGVSFTSGIRPFPPPLLPPSLTVCGSSRGAKAQGACPRSQRPKGLQLSRPEENSSALLPPGSRPRQQQVPRSVETQHPPWRSAVQTLPDARTPAAAS